MENSMKTMWIGAVAVLAVIIGFSGPAHAQSAQALPIPGVDAAIDLQGEHEVPDPKMMYKVAFDIGKAPAKIDEVNVGLIKISEFYNTLAKHGVPADHRKFIVVFHQQGTESVLNNAAFKTRHDGHDNPNIAIIQNMKKAGVDFRVCGQGVLGDKIDTATILPEVQVDLWAMVTLVNLQLEGYARVSGF
jgi:intracellular sulfur oxidation DsrE/DsrF family protein